MLQTRAALSQIFADSSVGWVSIPVTPTPAQRRELYEKSVVLFTEGTPMGSPNNRVTSLHQLAGDANTEVCRLANGRSLVAMRPQTLSVLSTAAVFDMACVHSIRNLVKAPEHLQDNRVQGLAELVRCDPTYLFYSFPENHALFPRFIIATPVLPIMPLFLFDLDDPSPPHPLTQHPDLSQGLVKIVLAHAAQWIGATLSAQDAHPWLLPEPSARSFVESCNRRRQPDRQLRPTQDCFAMISARS